MKTMAFWKHFGKKSSHGERNTKPAEVSSLTSIQNNNDEVHPPINHAVNLAANGDLGESLYSELYQSPDGRLESPKKQPSLTSKESINGDFSDLGDDFSAPELMRPHSRKSRLLKNLQEILVDLTALAYFQQYLESKQAATYLTLLNDIKNCNLLVNSLSPSATGGLMLSSALSLDETSPPEAKWSPSRNECKTQRLMNSTSSSSGFSDDISLESPGNVPITNRQANCVRRPETDTMIHSLYSEHRRIFHKYFDPESSDFLPSISPLAKPLADISLSTFETGTSVLDLLDYFRDIQESVCNLLETDYFLDYLHSEFHYRYQLEILTGGKLVISDILYNDTCLFYFMEFMDQEGKRHWLEYWLAANNFRSQWNAQNASADALIIYNKYFSLQASHSLGLSNVIRSAIEENICCSDRGPGPDCFEHAVHVVLCAMEKKYLQKFLTSQVYYQYLSEILSTFKTPTTFPLSRNKRSGSDSTINSEVSVVSSSATPTAVAVTSSVNSVHTSLASATNNSGLTHAESTMIRLINSISNESLVIDIRQLNDPDSLWKRKKYNLSLGYLTSIGRFQTEVEQLPDKKAESKLTKAVRKFVLVEEDQEKEEAAWQIAELIVKDVTSITLSKSEDCDSGAITKPEYAIINNYSTDCSGVASIENVS